MYWRKSCACCKNWKSSLHGSRWLILIGLLKIIGCKPTELSVYKSRLKNKKQPAQPVFLAEPLIPTTSLSSLPWERVRERATSRKACIWAVRVLGKIAAIWENALSPALPHGGGSRLQRIWRFWRFERQLGFTAVDLGRLKNKSNLHNLFSLQNP